MPGLQESWKLRDPTSRTQSLLTNFSDHINHIALGGTVYYSSDRCICPSLAHRQHQSFFPLTVCDYPIDLTWTHQPEKRFYQKFWEISSPIKGSWYPTQLTPRRAPYDQTSRICVFHISSKRARGCTGTSTTMAPNTAKSKGSVIRSNQPNLCLLPSYSERGF